MISIGIYFIFRADQMQLRIYKMSQDNNSVAIGINLYIVGLMFVLQR